MTVTVHIPAMLRAYRRDDTPNLQLTAATVRSALRELEEHHPSLYHSVCDETGAVRRHINLFVNNTLLRDRDGLDIALQPGDDLAIMPAVSGG